MEMSSCRGREGAVQKPRGNAMVCMLREEMHWLVKARVEDGDQGKIIFLLVLEI